MEFYKTLGQAVEESIAFLRVFEPAEGYRGGFSGGKDSIVLKELARMAGVKVTWIYSCTGIEPPEVVRFIRRRHPDVAFAFPRMTFWEGIRKKAPPTRKARWCCDVLKKAPTARHPLQNVITGIRAEESSPRAKRAAIGMRGKRVDYKPLFYWPEWAVWDFIHGQGLRYPNLYDEGFGRVGCVVCPFILRNNQTQLQQRMTRWPKYYSLFERVVRQWFAKNREGRDVSFETADQYLAAYYHGFMPPPKTSRGAVGPINCLADALLMEIA